MSVHLNFPKLTSYQQEVYDWLGDPYKQGKVAVIKSVRQSGKTFLLQIELIIMAVKHPGSVSIIYEPTLALARNVYKSMLKALSTTGLLKIANGQLLEIELDNGSQILFKSTEQTSRGLSVTGLLILDECAWLDEEAIYEILPLINAGNASLIIASTPYTMEGYFYDMYIKGLGDVTSIKTFDWSSHPEISRFLTEEKKQLYKQTMSRSKYTTEILGQFLTDGGLLFNGLDNVIGEPGDGPVVYIGIDFATGSENDYTVLSVIDNRGKMVEIHRTNKLTPTQQVEWLCELIEGIGKTKQIRTILAEQNSIGSVYSDMMRNRLKGYNLVNWVTTNKSKQDLVTAFQLAIENGYIGLLSEPNLLNELRKYQADINVKTKTVTYNGYKCNDDMVIATMLAYWAYYKGLGKISISFT